MPKKNPIPAYRRHSSKDAAVVDVYRHDGKRTKVYLPGAYDSPESKAAYAKLIALLQAHGGKLPLRPGDRVPDDLTIAEFVLRFMQEKVEVDYVYADGSPTNEVTCFRQALKPLVRCYGDAIARTFDSASLKIVRDAMIDGRWMTDAEREFARKQNRKPGRSRGYIRLAISRIRALFRWGVLTKIVGPEVVVDLQCLPALRPGKNGVRETAPVPPVPLEVVEKTIPFMPPFVGDMVRVQLLTGMRPGELCAMKGEALDRSGPVWLYNLTSHKTAHRGHKRTIAIGPKAQLILRRYLKDDPAAFVFSPAEQAEHIKAEKRRKRKTPVQPSQQDRSKPNPTRAPKNHYTTSSYNHGIRAGCIRADVPHWHAHQLRHTASMLIEREFGAEGARATLGHRRVNQTLHYSGIDTEKAIDVAGKVG